MQNALLELAGTHPALDAAALHRLFEDVSAGGALGFSVQTASPAILPTACTSLRHPTLPPAQLSDPDAVPPDAGDAGEEASGQEGGAYEPGDEALAGLEGGERGRRASSEESESSALGL